MHLIDGNVNKIIFKEVDVYIFVKDPNRPDFINSEKMEGKI